MVSLSMPQFLIYTFPFASLAASSMILGDLGSSNELLAVRSSGISLSHVYRPLIIVSILLSGVTFIFADVVHPWASAQYSVRLAELMQDMPTFEIEPNSVNTVGNIVLSNGQSEGNEIHDIVLISSAENGEDRTVLSERGVLDLIDNVNYVYALSLDNPTILLTDREDIDQYGYSTADRATFFLDFSEQIPSLTSTSPVNLSSRDLITGIIDRAPREAESQKNWHQGREDARLSLADSYIEAFYGNTEREELALTIETARNNVESYGEYPPKNTYSQYYKAELAKKFVLSAACFCLTLITLPLSMVKVKHGKLTGFAISLLIAVAYWYMIFGVQLRIFAIHSDPYLLMALPDIAILVVALLLLMRFRRAR